jgi:hypothetical protein
MSWIWLLHDHASRGRGKRETAASAAVAGPDFLCIGAHKAGTTWLYQQLTAHPDFWMPPFKELHYFDQLGCVKRAASPRRRDERDLLFLERMECLKAEPKLRLEHYARLFEVKGSLLSGDISPNYSTLTDGVIRQIARFFPELKVIYMARDPVDRFWSHLSMEAHYRQIPSFNPTNIEEVNRYLLRRGMLLRSYPSATVARWKRWVHPERFRVFFFDDLQTDPAKLRRSILEFLGADPHKVSELNPPYDRPAGGQTTNPNSWAGMKKLTLTDEVRSHLARFFEKELKACAVQLGGPARNWPRRYGF